MVLNVEKKWQKLILPVYLILAVICSFVFSTDQALLYEKSEKDILGSGSYFSSLATHTIDWLAEDAPTISKVHKYSNSPLRSGLLRVFVLAGLIGIALFLAKSNFKINKNNNLPIVKKLVPLKLLI